MTVAQNIYMYILNDWLVIWCSIPLHSHHQYLSHSKSCVFCFSTEGRLFLATRRKSCVTVAQAISSSMQLTCSTALRTTYGVRLP